MYKLPKGKRLVKVSDFPPTWLELDKSLTEEQIQAKIEDYRANTKTLKDMVYEGYFDSMKDSKVKKPINTAMEEVHVPYYNKSIIY